MTTPLPDPFPPYPVRADGQAVFSEEAETWNAFLKDVLAPYLYTVASEAEASAILAALSVTEATVQADRAEDEADSVAGYASDIAALKTFVREGTAPVLYEFPDVDGARVAFIAIDGGFYIPHLTLPIHKAIQALSDKITEVDTRVSAQTSQLFKAIADLPGGPAALSSSARWRTRSVTSASSLAASLTNRSTRLRSINVVSGSPAVQINDYCGVIDSEYPFEGMNRLIYSGSLRTGRLVFPEPLAAIDGMFITITGAAVVEFEIQ